MQHARGLSRISLKVSFHAQEVSTVITKPPFRRLGFVLRLTRNSTLASATLPRHDADDIMAELNSECNNLYKLAKQSDVEIA